MVHAYSLEGYQILLDVNSGLVHVADELTLQIIQLINQDIEAERLSASCPVIDVQEYAEKFLTLHPEHSLEDVTAALEEICELIASDALYTPDIYFPNLEAINARKTAIKAMCLHIAHDCNLACKYCFAEGGEYHSHDRSLMSFETGKKALDFLVENSGNRVNLEVDFFGGEPLMNFDVVKQLVAYGRSIEKEKNKNFRFTLTTNAMLLDDEITEFLNQEMANVVLSIDGRKEVNDAMRITRNGKGSFDIIVPRIQRFVSQRGDKDHYIRGTFTRNNLDFTNDIQAFLDLGFENLSIEPVVTTADYGIREEDIPTIMDEYEKLARLYLKRSEEGRPFTFFHFMIDLDQGPCVIKRLSGCGSGTEYVAVTPKGEIYPCHQFVGQEEFIIGNVDEGILNQEIPEQFRKASVYTKDHCDQCFAKFYCSGGCPANSWNFSKDINKVYEIGCKMQRKRVECAIMIKAALAEREGHE
ncbi:MAG: thioether cross-link-forming SCIFF peptide maturase [Parasporobacterium sp.]|nr:thioether cross-link-forming SCIFF peptide maturase [Parasporobacterium sp.]